MFIEYEQLIFPTSVLLLSMPDMVVPTTIQIHWQLPGASRTGKKGFSINYSGPK
jgi:hypothetical protein